MKPVVIAGYPKSGTTWLTRLVADLARCPSAGFWQSNHDEIAVEGLERRSELACYKSHHQLRELDAFREQPWKTIYIRRDPRDIVLSGAEYYYPAWRGRAWFRGRKKVREAMIRAVLYGEPEIHHWCRVSWGAHVAPYLHRPGILVVTYESLLETPENVCREILAFLGLERTADEISAAVSNQSFAVVKEKFRRENDVRRHAFLRRGVSGAWRQGLTKKETGLIEARFGSLLTEESRP